MFEEMTYETIMRSMMEDMPDDIDTSEGSLIFTGGATSIKRHIRKLPLNLIVRCH